MSARASCSQRAGLALTRVLPYNCTVTPSRNSSTVFNEEVVRFRILVSPAQSASTYTLIRWAAMCFSSHSMSGTVRWSHSFFVPAIYPQHHFKACMSARVGDASLVLLFFTANAIFKYSLIMYWSLPTPARYLGAPRH